MTLSKCIESPFLQDRHAEGGQHGDDLHAVLVREVSARLLSSSCPALGRVLLSNSQPNLEMIHAGKLSERGLKNKTNKTMTKIDAAMKSL